MQIMFGDQYGEFVFVYRAGGLKGEVLSPSSHANTHSGTHTLADFIIK